MLIFILTKGFLINYDKGKNNKLQNVVDLGLGDKLV